MKPPEYLLVYSLHSSQEHARIKLAQILNEQIPFPVEEESLGFVSEAAIDLKIQEHMECSGCKVGSSGAGGRSKLVVPFAKRAHAMV